MVHISVFLIALCYCSVDISTATIYKCDRTADCGCSKSDADVKEKIVGGGPAIVSSWGWAVSLQISLGDAFCGGAILSPSFVLTAAHCVTNSSVVLSKVKVVVGIDKLDESSSSKAQVRSVTKIHSHIGYNADTNVNDIAVLELDKPLILSNNNGTSRICLPNVVPANAADDYPSSGLPLVAIGWGLLKFDASSTPSNLQLQQVTLSSMSSSNMMCFLTINHRRLQFCAAVQGGGKGTTHDRSALTSSSSNHFSSHCFFLIRPV
jgi:hypothetical protein